MGSSKNEILNNKGVSLIDRFDPESPSATEFRRLLHNLNGAYATQVKRQRGESSLQEISSEFKRVMITSALGSEGKSTVASFMAIASAKLKERRTLLLDADLRRPTIHKLFSLDRRGGLVEILTEGLESKKAVKKTELPLLDIITAGRVAEHPGEIFDPERIVRALDELKDDYDFMVIDSPPALPVSDPTILGGLLDGALLVIKSGVTQKEVVLRAQTLLQGGGARLLGVALNNLNSSLPHYYDPGYYSYETEQ